MIPRCLRVVALGLSPAVLISGYCWQVSPGLEIDRIRPSPDAEVVFTTNAEEADPTTATVIQSDPQTIVRFTKDERYKICLPPSKIRAPSAGAYVSYDFYVIDLVHPAVPTRYRVNAVSVGSFLDTLRATGFRVGASEGQIDVPIYCPGRPNLIEVAEASDLTKVDISGGVIKVHLKNRSGMSLLVRVAGAAGQGLTASPTDPQRQYAINPSGTKGLDLYVKPSTVNALLVTTRSATAASPHGRLNLNLECEFGSSKSIELEPLRAVLPLDYTPSVGHLILMASAGAFIGWALCWLVSAGMGQQVVGGIRKLAIRLVISILLTWILGALSAASDSRMVVFGFDINPTRLAPAFVLGVFCGVLGTWHLGAVVVFLDQLNKLRLRVEGNHP